MFQPVVCGDGPEQAGGDNGAGQHADPNATTSNPASNIIPQQAPGLIPRKLPPVPLTSGNGHGAAVCVGVEGEDQVGIHVTGQRYGEVKRAGFLRVGKSDGGEVRVGCELLFHHMDVVKSRKVQGPPCHLAANAMHGGENNAHVTRRTAKPSNLLKIRRQHIHLLHPHRVTCDLVGWGSLSNARHDLGIGRRHDLHPIGNPGGDASTQVHLVSIVGARVVGCGDHDPGIGMKCADGEGGDGRR